MGVDLFISYAWTSDQHRQWVRLLAAQLKALGYDVLIDADLDYGDGLTGFMRRVVDARHVLIIADENYVERANDLPSSGVGVENRWLSEVHGSRPTTWLSVLFKDNPEFKMPDWLSGHQPKGHSFNCESSISSAFPGSEQVEELWRWIEDLPANRDNATPIATLRERSARLERQSLRCDPTNWRSPALEGEVHFTFADASSTTFHWGLGEFEFAFMVTGCGSDSVYVYRDPIQAVGIVRGPEVAETDLSYHLSPARSVVAHVGQKVVLMNGHGALSVVDILAVQREESGPPYVAPYVDFRWRVVQSS